jgi:hypothetical protein
VDESAKAVAASGIDEFTFMKLIDVFEDVSGLRDLDVVLRS